MNLTVLSVAYPFAPVGEDAVGGAEQVISRLDAALVRAGHRSIVVACEGSNVEGTLIATPAPAGTLTDSARRCVWLEHRRKIENAMRSCHVDVIHMHGIDFYEYVPPPGPPVLVTLHLPPGWYPSHAFDPARPRTYLHCVSANQRRACPPCDHLLPEIENGVPVEALAARSTRRRFALALGRVCPEKNFHVALDAGKQADIPVLLAGRVFPYEAHERYFQKEIVPRLDARRRFLGPIGFARKRRLLNAAQCLLLPTLAPETSSLVAMEALACGTPVIAFPSGNLPEIVEHGVTGFLVTDEREMAAAIEAADELDPDACRETAARRFSLEKTIEKYFSVYRQLVDQHTLQKSEWSMGAWAVSDGSPPRVAGGEARVTVEAVTTTASLERLRTEWFELWTRVPSARPFQSPQWLIPWWRHIGRGELRVLTLRAEGDRLVGLVPLYIYTESGGAVRTLFPLGVATTDYLDPLLEPAWEERGAAAVLDHIATQQEQWDTCDFPQLRAGSPLLRCPPPEGWTDQVCDGEPCPVLALPGSVEELPGCVPARMLQNLRYYRRRADRAGRWHIEAADPDNLEELCDALFRLHRARWSARGLPGVLDDRAVQLWHREALPLLLSAGTLRMDGLRLDGRIIAVFYGLADRERPGRKTYYYLGGFDPEFERLSPGTLLIGHAVERATREGCAAFDFLRGRESYKRLWGATETTIYRRRFRHARVPQIAAAAV